MTNVEVKSNVKAENSLIIIADSWVDCAKHLICTAGKGRGDMHSIYHLVYEGINNSFT
jgi:hypothetical protein